MKSYRIRPASGWAILMISVMAVSPLVFAQTPPSRTAPPTQAAASQAASPRARFILSSTQYVDADFLEQSEKEKKLTASGSVAIYYNEIILYADQVVFDQETKDLLAVGHVTVIRPDEAFSADRLTFNMETGLGEGTNVVGLVQPAYRYESSSIQRVTPILFHLGKSKITACAQPVPRWEFSASKANFMRDEYIEMWNPVLRVKNIPLFWFPYIKYPLNPERETGFLMPQIGYSQRKGFTFTEQFYWAIARNMDMTFSMDYYGAAGAGGGLESRYLFADGTWGQLNAYTFFYNTPAEGEKPDNAVLFRWQHSQQLPGKISFVASVDYQNSFSFMREFDNNYARALVFNRSSQVYLTKSWTGANLSVRFSRFETSFPGWDNSIVRQSLPQVGFSTFQRKLWGPLYFSLNATYNNWQYGYGSQFEDGSVRKSSELYIGPTLSLPFNKVPWFTLNMTAAGNLSYYGNSQDPDTGLIVNKGLLSGNYILSASFTGPIIYKIYNPTGPGMRFKHVIEPEISYHYDSPTIDSDKIVTMTGWFFRYHFVTYGLTNRVLMKKGNDPKARAREIFTWGISQALYLDPETSPLSWYRLDDGTIPRFSDISTYVRFFPLEGASLDLSAGYNTYRKTLSSVRASASFGNPSDNLFFSLSWYKSFNPYYTEAYWNREQIGLNGGLKFPRLGLEALGEFEYNIMEKKILYSGLSAVWHYQCIDFKADVRAFFFREKPEVQVRFSFGLGNISSTSDFLGGSQVESAAGAGGRSRRIT